MLNVIFHIKRHNMYRAVYAFTSKDNNALDFSENDLFTVVDNSRDQYWWLVQNGKGQVGFVPANYLKKNEASREDVIQSIERAIQIIRESAPMGNLQNLTQLQKANLVKLENHKERVIEEYSLNQSRDAHLQPIRRAPQTPISGNRTSSKRSSIPPPPPVRNSVLSSPTSPSLGQSSPFAKNGTSLQMPQSANQHQHENQMLQTNNCKPADNTQCYSDDLVGREVVDGVKNLELNTQLNYEQSETVSYKNENAANSPTCESFCFVEKSEQEDQAHHKQSTSCLEQTSTIEIKPACKHCQNAKSDYVTNFNNVIINKDIGRKLIEKMRSSTQMSYSKSQQAVDLVLQCLRQDIPQIGPVMQSVLYRLHKQDMDTSNVDLTTEDAVRLQEIFSELGKCKDDSQQRSWFLHEDEHIISGHLKDLLSVFDGAHADVSKAIVVRDDFSAINSLVLYYQMETRGSLRMLLLQVFGSLCALDAMFISELLTSVLPMELARDIQTDFSDIQKLSYSCLVLTMIFSMGESVPLQCYTQLNEAFIHFLFDMVENPPDSDSSHQLPELVVNLILAYNLHFELPSDSTVMKVLAAKGTSKVFTERVVVLVNRGDDPVRMFEHEPKPQSTVLKFLSDLYSSRETSGVMYTNDAMVLIDIIVGQITDLSPAEQVRTEYLSLMELILQNTDYRDHCHKRAELQLCFKRIYHEEEESANDMDKVIVQQIYTQFSDLFNVGEF